MNGESEFVFEIFINEKTRIRGEGMVNENQTCELTGNTRIHDRYI